MDVHFFAIDGAVALQSVESLCLVAGCVSF